jgi:hypothetical protein
MLRGQGFENVGVLLDEQPQPLQHQRVLGIEMPVDGHLGRFGLCRNGIHRHPTDAFGKKQLLGCIENSFSWGQLGNSFGPHDALRLTSILSGIVLYQQVSSDTDE